MAKDFESERRKKCIVCKNKIPKNMPLTFRKTCGIFCADIYRRLRSHFNYKIKTQLNKAQKR